MNIGEAARLTGLKTKTIRYYAEIGLVTPDSRSKNGYRQYDDKSIRKLIFIKQARSFGFAIPECRELLSLYEDKNRSSADVKQIASTLLKQIEEKMNELQMLHDELSHLIANCQGDNRPDCPIIDALAAKR